MDRFTKAFPYWEGEAMAKKPTTVVPPTLPTKLADCRYWYHAVLIDDKDGDSFRFLVDCGLDGFRKLETRLAGIDCPELETPEGKEARQAALSWIESRANMQRELIIRTVKDRTEKYGRYLVWVFAEGGECLNVWLWNQGHAVPYGGGKR